jgi:hypothetical protein
MQAICVVIESESDEALGRLSSSKCFKKKKKYFFKTCSLIWLLGGKVLLFVYIISVLRIRKKYFLKTPSSIWL